MTHVRGMIGELEATATTPEAGQLVSVRKRQFVVLDVQESPLPPPGTKPETHRSQHLVRMSSVEDDGLGEELSVIWELEPGARSFERGVLPDVQGFDSPERLEAFLNAVRWGAVSSADSKALQAPFRSGIEIDDYQLDPVVRALTMPRVNLLIADDVGLGKTIEGGLVIQELMLRHRIRSILVVCPSSLQIQWQEEMRDKFGLEFRIVNSQALGELRRKRGIHVNPWTHFPRLITSIDFFKRERVLRTFRETLPAGDQPTYPRKYDLLIVDEAHNVAPSGRGRYAIESQRTQAIRAITPHFEHKLFLSATPHNGFSESFASLLEMLDNQRFARAVDIDRKQLDAVMVRRLKEELKFRGDGSRRFADRVVAPIEVPYTEPERAAHALLKEYTRLRQENASTQAEKFASEFVLKLLKKRLFSSPAAFHSTLEKHAESLRRRSNAFTGGAAWKGQIESAEDDYLDDDEFEEVVGEAVEAASDAFGELTKEEASALKRLREYASDAALKPDSKANALLDWLNVHIRPKGQWGTARVIIFTEYRTTQNWLHDLLAQHGYAKDGRLLMLNGSLPQEEREIIKAAFQASPDDAPVRILLATDAASEGVNLQNHCSRLIHYEIPWNPTRMEQRNGRVDRHGQRAEEVSICHFVASGFDQAKPTGHVGDLEADLEFLMRAAIKVENIREDLGKVGPVIAAQVEEAMLGKRKALDTSRAEDEAKPVRQMLKFERQLRDQLQKLTAQLNETREELHLSPANIEEVVKAGLELAGQPPLRAVAIPGPDGVKTTAWHLPAFTGSWIHCKSGLEHPHTKVMRPIVFDPDLIKGRDDVVLGHLNHRLVQMCLRLLRAEIWSVGSTRNLHRVTACVSDSPEIEAPTIVAHGRVVVLGGDNHRLHEEIIMAGGVVRGGRYARLNVGQTKAVAESATMEAVADARHDALRSLWKRHRDSVVAALNSRTEERTRNLEKAFQERADSEVAKLRAIMTELQKAIQAELATRNDPQMTFDFTKDEKEQRNRDLDALSRRLEEIPAEMEAEEKHLRSRYENPTPRLFPVAVTLIVPRGWKGEAQ